MTSTSTPIRHVADDHPDAVADRVRLAQGESVIKSPSPLNVLKDTYDHICY